MVNINNLKTTMYTIMFKLNKKDLFLLSIYKNFVLLTVGVISSLLHNPVLK